MGGNHTWAWYESGVANMKTPSRLYLQKPHRILFDLLVNMFKSSLHLELPTGKVAPYYSKDSHTAHNTVVYVFVFHFWSQS